MTQSMTKLDQVRILTRDYVIFLQPQGAAARVYYEHNDHGEKKNGVIEIDDCGEVIRVSGFPILPDQVRDELAESGFLARSSRE